MTYPTSGVIASTELLSLEVRECDAAYRNARYGRKTQSKHHLTFRVTRRLVNWFQVLGFQCKLLVVRDGSCDVSELIARLPQMKIKVVNRLKSNAKLLDLPQN
jgi:hypothetical protein